MVSSTAVPVIAQRALSRKGCFVKLCVGSPPNGRCLRRDGVMRGTNLDRVPRPPCRDDDPEQGNLGLIRGL